MKLQTYDETLEEKMSEFDIWVTPSLGEIRDMPQFKVNLDSMKSGFDYMAQVTSMAGSGTTGASAMRNGFRAILCDKNEDYISLMENRLNVKRISL